MDSMVVKIENLSKSFLKSETGPPLQVLDHVKFDVHAGEFLALVGPSGCGKTTLLRMIAGIELPDSGSARIADEFRAEHLPIVWQEHRLFPWLSVKKNVSFPIEMTDASRSEIDKLASELLTLVGLDGFEDYYPAQVSGGMAARVAIARALAAGTRFVLMDEPFASVDYQTKRRLFRELHRIRESRSLTFIYVTHDVRDAISNADRIVILSDRPASVICEVCPRKDPRSKDELEEYIWSLLRGRRDTE